MRKFSHQMRKFLDQMRKFLDKTFENVRKYSKTFENIRKYSKSWVKYSKIFDFFGPPCAFDAKGTLRIANPKFEALRRTPNGGNSKQILMTKIQNSKRDADCDDSFPSPRRHEEKLATEDTEEER